MFVCVINTIWVCECVLVKAVEFQSKYSMLLFIGKQAKS